MLNARHVKTPVRHLIGSFSSFSWNSLAGKCCAHDLRVATPTFSRVQVVQSEWVCNHHMNIEQYQIRHDLINDSLSLSLPNTGHAPSAFAVDKLTIFTEREWISADILWVPYGPRCARLTESTYLPSRRRGSKYRRGQLCAPRAISRAKYQPIFTRARWILYLNLKSVLRKLLVDVRALRALAAAVLV